MAGECPASASAYLYGKLHHTRMVLCPGDVHVGRQTQKRSRQGYHLTVDKAWSEVVRNIQKYTAGESCWLTCDMALACKQVADLDERNRHGVKYHSIEL